MTFRVALLACAGLFAGVSVVPAASASPMPIDQAAKLFGARPTAFAADLSPDGDKLVYLSAGPGASTVAHLIDFAKRTDMELARSNGKPQQLHRCGFSDERWVICSFGGMVHDLDTTYRIGRTVALDTVTGAFHPLAATIPGKQAFVQFDGTIVDWLPDEKNSVLMERTYPTLNNSGEQFALDRIQLDPFKATQAEPASTSEYDYITDGHGVVRVRSLASTDVEGDYTGVSKYQYRTTPGGKWFPLRETDADFRPLAVDRGLNALYFLKPLNGRAALYRMQLDGSGAETLVASSPDYDIDSVIQFGPGDPVVGFRYTNDRTRSIYIDPTAQALGKGLTDALTDMPLINVLTSSRDGNKILLSAGSDVDPGVYYILDRTARRLEPVLRSRDALNGIELAPMKAVTVATSDGKSIPAYVTMRSDLGSGPHPAIVMPHGGPSDRDSWGFDWLGQFLAARGYVVIQPNFRGSSGYGKEFLGENAFHEWRKVMSDIHDSADWLVKQGLADPNRMAIVGWSYGGYAALQSAAMDHRYKAVVAIAPVTDLKLLRRDAEGFREKKMDQQEIGKGDQLSDGSPINHAADIHAPVLLVHGTLDGNVDYDHSKHMLAALQHAGDSADLLTFDGLDHQLDDSDARTQMLVRIGQLLDKTIGD